MNFKQAINENSDEDKDVFILLESLNVEKASKEDLTKLINHLKKQFKTRYQYLVGEWRNAHRAKNTRNGQFASVDEVSTYLKGKTPVG